MQVALFFFLAVPYAFADTVRVAVAANFAAPLKGLALEFERKTGYRIQVISGSSGKLYAQIIQGAPFDLFLSADTLKPLALVEQGKASKVFTYARGQLVIFVSERVLPQASTPAFMAWLKSAASKRIAIANLSVAPYGQAATALLNQWMTNPSHADHLGYADSSRHAASRIKVIHAENISQVAHYVKSGSVDVGFMAASLLPFKVVKLHSGKDAEQDKLDADQNKLEGSYWQRVTNGWLWWPPVQSYDAIIQQGVILPSARQSVAQAFSEYLVSDEVQLNLQRHWYYLPMVAALNPSSKPMQLKPSH